LEAGTSFVLDHREKKDEMTSAHPIGIFTTSQFDESRLIRLRQIRKNARGPSIVFQVSLKHAPIIVSQVIIRVKIIVRAVRATFDQIVETVIGLLSVYLARSRTPPALLPNSARAASSPACTNSGFYF
jgi:hypothetical protein